MVAAEDMPVRLMPVEQCGKEPMSLRVLLDELGSSQLSGHKRRQMLAEVEAAIAAFYEAARAIVETDEQAAALVLRMVARDPDYQASEWMRELFAAHREGLEELFHDPDRGRASDYGDARAEGESGKVEGAPRRNPHYVPISRLQRLAPETLATVAELFMSGRVAEAARLAGVLPQELSHGREFHARFRAACSQAVQHRYMREAAE